MAGIGSGSLGHTTNSSLSSSFSFDLKRKNSKIDTIRPSGTSRTNSPKVSTFDWSTGSSKIRSNSLSNHLKQIDRAIYIKRTNSTAKFKNLSKIPKGNNIPAQFAAAALPFLFFSILGKTTSFAKISGSLLLVNPIRNLGVITARLPEYKFKEIQESGKYKITLKKPTDQENRTLSSRDSLKRSLSYRNSAANKGAYQEASSDDMPKRLLKIEKKINEKINKKSFGSAKDAQAYINFRMTMALLRYESSAALTTHIASPLVVALVMTKATGRLLSYSFNNSIVIPRYSKVRPDRFTKIQKGFLHLERKNQNLERENQHFLSLSQIKDRKLAEANEQLLANHESLNETKAANTFISNAFKHERSQSKDKSLEIDRLNQLLADTFNELKNLQNESTNKDTRIAQAKTANDKKEQQIDHLLEVIDRLQYENTSLKKSKSEQETCSSHPVSTTQNNTILRKLQQSELAAKSYKKEIADLKQDVSNGKLYLKHLNAKYNELGKKELAKAMDLEDKVEALQANEQKLTDRIEYLETENAGLKSRLDDTNTFEFVPMLLEV